MNYLELSDQIQQVLQNDEESFVDEIPNFVTRAEQKIYRLVPTLSTKLTTTGAFSTGTATYAAPTGMLAPRWLRYQATGSETKFCDFKDASALKATFYASTNGEPRYYALSNDSTLEIAPAPDNNYSYTFGYTGFPTTIVGADTNTSWLGTYAEGALLWAAIVEAYIYMKGDSEILNGYKEKFAEALAELQVEVQGRTVADHYRYGEARA